MVSNVVLESMLQCMFLNLPEHMTAASWLCEQLVDPTTLLSWRHANSDGSEPEHFRPLSNMGPAPWPKYAPRNATALPVYGMKLGCVNVYIIFAYYLWNQGNGKQLQPLQCPRLHHILSHKYCCSISALCLVMLKFQPDEYPQLCTLVKNG